MAIKNQASLYAVDMATTPVTDGQFLFNTEKSSIFLDKEQKRNDLLADFIKQIPRETELVEGGESTEEDLIPGLNSISLLGSNNVTPGAGSAALGVGCKSRGNYSISLNGWTRSEGFCSLAAGGNSIASSDYSTVIGKNNWVDTEKKYAFIVGNGENYGLDRSSMLTLDWSGNAVLRHSVTAPYYFVDAHSNLEEANSEREVTEEEAKKVLNLTPISFLPKYHKRIDQREVFGLKFADVQQNVPAAASENDWDTENKFWDEECSKVPGINYMMLVPLLVKMIQMQQVEIDTLKDTVGYLPDIIKKVDEINGEVI